MRGGGAQDVLPGTIIVLQPNIRYCGADYWMFFDHVTPLEEHSLQEVLEQTGFRVRTMIPRFLPYTTVGKRDIPLWMILWYLRMPWAWRFFGKQTLVVAEKTA